MDPGSRIKDLPAAERPRERLTQYGADALSNIDLLAILLRTGTKGSSALQTADHLIRKFRTLDQLSRASLEELCQVKGIGPDKAIALTSAFTLARRLAREQAKATPIMDTPERIADLLREESRKYAVEHFQIVLLNTRRKLIHVQHVSDGTLDTLLVHPREVFRMAIASNASSIVLVHNHPSGDPTPSDADVKVTRDLIRAGQLLKIEVLDHIILGQRSPERPRDFVSLRELGYFYS